MARGVHPFARSMALDRRRFLQSVASFTAAGMRLLRADDTRFATDVQVVNILATVRDAKGRIVRDLAREDFTVDDEGRPQSIRYFAAESDLPLTIGLLVDTSLSQKRVLGAEKNASYTFFDRMVREQRDHAYVIHFDREVELLQDLTSSRRDLKAALAALNAASDPKPHSAWVPAGSWNRGRYGGTKLYDAVLLASDELMRKRQGRKALILLTDGVDIGSKTSLQDAVRAALRADTLVYSILFADADFYEFHPRGREVLAQFAASTGGGFFEVSEDQPIANIYRRIEEELRSQYSLGYVPDQPTSGFHHIRVSARPGFAVQARNGYYTP